MEIKMKKKVLMGYARLEGHAKIDDLMMKEDLAHPEKERAYIYFKGKDVSGILTLGKEEIERLSKTLQSKSGLLKGIKRL